MQLWQSYRLRLRRRRWHIRAFRKSRELTCSSDNTAKINANDVIVFSTIRNEDIRLPYFLEYYRNIGVNHFVFIDNDSDDGGPEFLRQQPDVTLYETQGSYKHSRFGMDWVNWLLKKIGHGHWCLVVDPDEFFVFPFSDNRPIQALTDWLDASSLRSFSAMLLDMYPKGPIHDQAYKRGQNPLEITQWFDSGNYTYEKNHRFGNLWIQGGPRARAFFNNNPKQAPALNKVPLIKWHKRYVYESSTHMVLPRGLNLAYEKNGGELASGVLLHTKFLDTLSVKAKEELARNQHYANSAEYQRYAQKIENSVDLWHRWSEQYINWRQLEILGLMSKGNWA